MHDIHQGILTKTNALPTIKDIAEMPGAGYTQDALPAGGNSVTITELVNLPVNI